MRVHANGSDFHVTLAGHEDRPALLLGHSLATSHEMWALQLPLFARHFRVVAFDMRGHGASAAPAGPYAMDQLADDAAAVAEALGIRRFHFCGLSIGGMIGQTIALRANHPFTKMVFADTTHTQPPEAIKQWEDRIRIAESQGMKGLLDSTMERWFTPPFRSSPAAKKIAELILATPVAGYVGCGRAIMRLDRHDRFRFATAQSPLGEALFRHFGLPIDDYETNLVLVDGVAYQRLDGFIAAMAALGWPWRAARLLRLLPAGLRDSLYGLIARNRYRIFGRRAQCEIPSKAFRERLVG